MLVSVTRSTEKHNTNNRYNVSLLLIQMGLVNVTRSSMKNKIVYK